MSEPVTGAAGKAETGARALLLDPDLFFSVKVSATLRHVNLATVTVRSAEEWARRLAAEPFAVTLVNISARGVDWAAAIRAASPPQSALCA